jgi:hypothetical protein
MWHSLWKRLFSLLRKVECHVERSSLERHMNPKCQCDSMPYRVLMASLSWCIISNGTHLERKITDVNVLSRHNAHSSLHFYISCWKQSSFKRNFHVWMEVHRHTEWPEERMLPHNQTVAQQHWYVNIPLQWALENRWYVGPLIPNSHQLTIGNYISTRHVQAAANVK